MTVYKSNKKTRDIAIPFEAAPYSGQTVDDYYVDVLNYDGLASGYAGAKGFDPSPFTYFGNPTLNTPLSFVRCCTPDRGTLQEMTLTLEILCGAALTLKIGIGRWTGDLLKPVYELNQTKINADHLLLTGSASALSAPAGGVILVNGLDLMPALPKHGDPTFNRDGFILLFQYSRFYSDGASTPVDRVQTFSVMGSALMGLF